MWDFKSLAVPNGSNVDFTQENIALHYPEDLYSRTMLSCSSMGVWLHPGFYTHEELAALRASEKAYEDARQRQADWENSWRGSLITAVNRVKFGLHVGFKLASGKAYLDQYGEYTERED